MTNGEDIIFTGRPSRKLIQLEAISMALGFLLLSIILLTVKGSVQVEAKTWNMINYISYSLFTLITVFRMLRVTIKVYSLKYTLTNEILEVKTGLLSIRTDIVQLYRIKDIVVFQPFYYRFFNLGDIQVLSTDISQPTLSLEAIDDFEDVKNKIRENVEKNRKNSVLETI